METTKKKVLYPELEAEMARNGERQDALAELLGCSTAAISKRLRGLTQWTIHEVDIVCRHYGKSYEDLFIKGE